MKLSETSKGETVIVSEMDLPKATMMRLKALGMTNGAEVKVLARRGTGMVICSVRGTRLAIGKSISCQITVVGGEE